MNGAKLAFLFITENSIGSSWVSFEAGYMHSKGINVIPVSLPGIDMARVPPPLNFLQGFNMHSHDAMNNVFAVLNKAFGTTFKPTFTTADFDTVFNAPSANADGWFGEYTSAIHAVDIEGSMSADLQGGLRQALKEQGIDLVSLDLGKQVKSVAPGFSLVTSDSPHFKLSIHAEVAHILFPLLQLLLQKGSPAPDFTIALEFAKGITDCGEFTASARCLGTELRVQAEHSIYHFRDMILATGIFNPIRLKSPRFDPDALRDLVALLLDRELLVWNEITQANRDRMLLRNVARRVARLR